MRSLPELEARLTDIYSLKDQVDEWTMSFGEIDPDKVMQAVKEMREILQLPWDKWESERDADDKTGRRVYSLMLWAHETLPGSLPLEREKDGYRELALKISLSSDPSRLLDFVQSLKDLRRGMVAEHLKTVPKAPWALLSDSIPDLGIHLAEIYSLRYQVDRWSGPLADPGWDELVVTVNEIREILGEVRWAT